MESVGSAFHKLCPKNNGSLILPTPTATRPLEAFTLPSLAYKKFFTYIRQQTHYIFFNNLYIVLILYSFIEYTLCSKNNVHVAHQIRFFGICFSCIPDKEIHVFYLDRQFLSHPCYLTQGWIKITCI